MKPFRVRLDRENDCWVVGRGARVARFRLRQKAVAEWYARWLTEKQTHEHPRRKT
jgi:hypothetical protein